MNTATRPYRQTARAAAAAATRQRIVESAHELLAERWYDEVTLREIAAAAGVALQTVINHFGTKDGVLEAVVERFEAQVRARRFGVEPDDVEAAVAALVDDYEETGDTNLRALALEERVPALAGALARARAVHREWVERTFPALIGDRTGAERERRVAQLCTALDVLTWKVLRRDHGLSRRQTQTAMTEILHGLETR